MDAATKKNSSNVIYEVLIEVLLKFKSSVMLGLVELSEVSDA